MDYDKDSEEPQIDWFGFIIWAVIGVHILVLIFLMYEHFYVYAIDKGENTQIENDAGLDVHTLKVPAYNAGNKDLIVIKTPEGWVVVTCDRRNITYVPDLEHQWLK